MSAPIYVALGDSFTVGTGCRPGEAWPELVAAGMRSESPDLQLRNLAEHGATSGQVAKQVHRAGVLEAGLVTLVFGANDVLTTTRPDVGSYALTLEESLRALARPGRRIVTATVPERWHFMDLGPRTTARVSRGITRMNDLTRQIASAHDVPCLDMTGHPALSEPESFSADGLHPSALGHLRVARGFAALLESEFGLRINIDTEEGRHAITSAT